MFYSLSTLVGYLMPNSVYTHMLNMYDLFMNRLKVKINNRARAHLCAHSFQAWLFGMNSFI